MPKCNHENKCFSKCWVIPSSRCCISSIWWWVEELQIMPMNMIQPDAWMLQLPVFQAGGTKRKHQTIQLPNKTAVLSPLKLRKWSSQVKKLHSSTSTIFPVLLWRLLFIYIFLQQLSYRIWVFTIAATIIGVLVLLYLFVLNKFLSLWKVGPGWSRCGWCSALRNSSSGSMQFHQKQQQWKKKNKSKQKKNRKHTTTALQHLWRNPHHLPHIFLQFFPLSLEFNWEILIWIVAKFKYLWRLFIYLKK